RSKRKSEKFSFMHQPDLLTLFIPPLEQGGFEYMVTGSVASTLYGEPRLTHDIDLVIVLRVCDIGKLCDLFPSSDYYCPPPEVIRIELNRKTFAHFNLIHHDSGYKADCYPFTGNPLHAWALRNRKKIEIDSDISVQTAPPEYVIIRKLQFFREGGSEKHLSDIRKMMLAGGLDLDESVMLDWIQKLELQNEWKRIKTPDPL
ncbi:MAG: hypothetical protein ACLFVQ_13130, partial [Chitinispirillaceae bacterium]